MQQRYRRRAANWIVVALGVAALACGLPRTAAADPISDQQAVVAKVTDQLNALERRSDSLGEDYLASIAAEKQLAAQVAVSAKRVADQEVAVSTMRAQLAKVAVHAYLGAASGNGSPIFETTATVTDGLARDQLARVASNTGATTTHEYEQALNVLRDERSGLQRDRSRAAAKASQLAAAKQAAEHEASVYAKAQADAKAKLGDLVQQEQQRRARESYLRMQAAAQQAAAQRAAAQQAAALQQQAAAHQAAAQTRAGAPPEHALMAAPAATNGTPAPARAPSPPAASSSPPPPPPSSRASIAVRAALSQLGVPYRFAAATPGVAFDCSGLTMWAWAQAGVSLPHQSLLQFDAVPHVPKQDAQPGDLLFFYSGISHVTIYLGNGQNVSAPHTGAVVYVSAVNWNDVVGVGRPG